MRIRAVLTGAATALLALGAACSPADTTSGSSETTSSAAAGEGAAPSAPAGSADAAADAGAEKFYGKKAFTIVYSQTGVEAGSVVEHVRDWGARRAEITDTKLTAAGMTIEKSTRVVFEGAKVTTIDTRTGAVTQITNPLYDQIVGAMRGRSAIEFGEQMMRSMNGEKTGETAKIAGETCNWWQITQLGTRTCVTEWGASLATRSSLGGMSFEKEATEIRLDDGGPDEAFAYDPAKVQAGPDIGALLERAGAR